MPNCPHCGKVIDASPSAELAWYKYDRGHGVSLGCGTLILIALIVMVFSNNGTGGKAAAIRALQDEIQQLEKKIDKLAESNK